jgi:hypothetical protein
MITRIMLFRQVPDGNATLRAYVVHDGRGNGLLCFTPTVTMSFSADLVARDRRGLGCRNWVSLHSCINAAKLKGLQPDLAGKYRAARGAHWQVACALRLHASQLRWCPVRAAGLAIGQF